MTSSKGKNRTSISLSSGSYARLREYTLREGRSMSGLVEELATDFLNRLMVRGMGPNYEGAIGERLGPSTMIRGVYWTAVIWDGHDHPSWIRTDELDDCPVI